MLTQASPVPELQHIKHMTTPIRILTPALFAAAFVSCSPQADQYDTPPVKRTANPYDTAQAEPQTPGQPANTSNPVYDTPPAYEDNATVTPVDPGDIADPGQYSETPATSPSKVPANGAAIIHTVVSGDTLSGISAKYKIPSASIKQANRMTSDTVVLGRKMVIPPR